MVLYGMVWYVMVVWYSMVKYGIYLSVMVCKVSYSMVRFGTNKEN